MLRFSYGERVDDEAAARFDKEVRPRLSRLQALGRWIAARILEDSTLLEEDWKQLAEKLLEEAYQAAGLDTPEWLSAWAETRGDVYEDIREMIREYIIERVNSAFFRAVGRLVVEHPSSDTVTLYKTDEVTLEDRVRVVLEKNLLPWAALRNETVIITAGLARELASKIGDIGGPKSIAELLGWEYKVVKLGGRSVKAAVVPLGDFIAFLEPPEPV